MSFLIVLVALGLACSCQTSSPRRILWIWEHSDDVRFLVPADAELAVLRATVLLRGQDEVAVQPRRQPVLAHKAMTVHSVVRIQVEGAARDMKLSAAHLERTVAAIRALVHDDLQIDFDAAESQRSFYRTLLGRLRPHYKRLAMTALASWCMDDRWLGELPVDEITPMLFRLGPGGAGTLQRLEAAGKFAEARCRGSVGVSTDEPLRWRPAAARLYVFHAMPWDREAWEKVSKL